MEKLPIMHLSLENITSSILTVSRNDKNHNIIPVLSFRDQKSFSHCLSDSKNLNQHQFDCPVGAGAQNDDVLDGTDFFSYSKFSGYLGLLYLVNDMIKQTLCCRIYQ